MRRIHAARVAAFILLLVIGSLPQPTLAQARTVVGFDSQNLHWFKSSSSTEPSNLFIGLQHDGSGLAERVRIAPRGVNGLSVLSDGNAGIGMTIPTPTARLHVDGSKGLRLSDPSHADSYMTIKPSVSVGALNPGLSTVGAQITNRYLGHLLFDIRANDPNDSFAIRTDTDYDHTVDYIALVVKPSGNVGIGTTAPGAYKLAVRGTAIATEVVVEEYGNGNWPDFVFAEDYDLPTLEAVEAYIKANGHLPAVPTAAEVAETGIALGEMQATLLQKIEELTLYAIEQQAKNDSLQQQVSEQHAQNKALRQHLAQLEARLQVLEQR